ncbi:hypothetical protein [Aurantimonas coralicida]|uniref:hypothetical protein n=1 Tax=Aurantimonas coralicida TaxID=182270 RepID=UPI001E5817A3|nr:hypothetical protein [Aurantimonas coralicida]MCD1645518.1 hypothetical protein [Aurantimonas coralicida]
MATAIYLTSLLRRFRCLFRAPEHIRREAMVLVAMHGPQGAWVTARDKRRLAQAVDAADDVRRWNTVMREIERQTGYQHQSDTAKRMTES